MFFNKFISIAIIIVAFFFSLVRTHAVNDIPPTDGPLFFVSNSKEISFPRDENGEPLYPGPKKNSSKNSLHNYLINIESISIATWGVASYLVIKKLKLIGMLTSLGSSLVYADAEEMSVEELELELKKLELKELKINN